MNHYSLHIMDYVSLILFNFMHRFEAHTKNCPSCSKALKFANDLKSYNKYISLAMLIVFKPLVLKLFSVLFYVVTDYIANKLRRAMLGPLEGERVSASALK